MSVQVVRAAAGCGKTTELACRYLGFVAAGLPVEQIIAITFTRRAAAELQERVALALRACLLGPRGHHARHALGAAWPVLERCAPDDPRVVRAALEGLPHAPIGTTDAFIQQLLTEFALHAALPIPGESAAPLDIPIRAGGGLSDTLTRAARRILDPPQDVEPDPDVLLLSRYFTLDQLVPQLSWRGRLDHLPVARCTEVMARVARAIAAALLSVDLAAAYAIVDPASLDAWRDGLARKTNVAGAWAVEPVARWMHGGRPIDRAPWEIAGWLRGLEVRSKGRRAIRDLLQTTTLDLGIGVLTLHEVIDALRYPYEDPDHVALADELRAARQRLRRRVVAAGLRDAARAGQLDHDALTEAAIALCEAPPDALRSRYRALLVDEVQDASPVQTRLYRAIAGLGDVRACFVGDSRQSIYLFRGAEPAGFEALGDEARAQGDTDEALLTNHRSTPALVGAQRTLFGALVEPLEDAHLLPLESLEDLAHDEANARHVLSDVHHPTGTEPVWIVHGPRADRIDAREADLRALRVFLDRVQRAWEEPDHHDDTAVVLASTWAMAREACTRLREWAGSDAVAFVEGGTSWSGSRVVTDLVLLLRALTDATDDIAWLGVLKQPMVGLSDGAVGLCSRGIGLEVEGPEGSGAAPAWMARHLGHAIHADALGAPHLPVDQRTFARAAPVLREAVAALGQRDTAEVLDGLLSALDARTVLAAGPGGQDDVAAIEVMLDWIRGLEGEGRDVHGIISALRDETTLEPPRLHLHRPERTIACTTVFQAKGLAWDHVMVASPGRPSRLRIDEEAPTTWVQLDEPVRLAGLFFDPSGGLSPFKDPLGRLGARLEQQRADEECVRLAYVAVTRARRSVTLGLPSDPARLAQVQALIATAWRRLPASSEIRQVEQGEVEEGAPRPPAWVDVRHGAVRRERAAARKVWQERQPSSLSARLGTEVRARRAEWVVTRARLSNGLHLGAAPVHPSPDPDLDVITATAWGELAHGWLATWRFQGEPDPEAARAHLRARWASDDPRLVDWLVAVSRQLAVLGGPLWDLVTAPRTRLHFELPLAGPLGDTFVAGRADLVVARRGRLVVVDFKAGARSPSGWHDLLEEGGLRSYGPQLDAYRDLLSSQGYTVDAVALWYVRSGTSLRW